MEQIRKLGTSEKAKANRQHICNIVVPTLLKTHCQLDVERLDKAVCKVVKSQPNLNAVLRQDGDGDLYFIPLKDIGDYFEMLPTQTDWKDVCIEYSNRHLRPDLETLQPFKVFFIQPSSKEAILIVVTSHYALDGTGILAMTSVILETYSKLQDDLNYTPIHYEAPKSLEEYRLECFDFDEAELIEKQKRFKQYHLKVMDSVNCSFDFVESSKIVFTPYSSTNKQFADFKSACKNQSVTVGAALCAAQAYAMAACIFSHQTNVPNEVNLVIEVPMNLRGRVTDKVPWKCANFMASGPYVSIKVSRTSTFWNTVHRVKESFQGLLNDESKFYVFDLFSSGLLFNKSEDQQRIENARMKMNGLMRHGCFSNMKMFPGPLQHKEFTVDVSYCCGGQWLLPSVNVLELYVYSTDRLNLTMVHRDGPLNVERAEEALNYVRYLVENASDLSDKDIIVAEISTFS